VQKHHVIRLRNAIFYAYHGIASDEQRMGGKFEVDVDLHVDLTNAAEHDNLQQTVDYEKVYDCIREIVLSKNFFLIESLAAKIAKGILSAFGQVEQVVVRVRKPSAPVKGVVDYVEVEIAEKRH